LAGGKRKKQHGSGRRADRKHQGVKRFRLRERLRLRRNHVQGESIRDSLFCVIGTLRVEEHVFMNNSPKAD